MNNSIKEQIETLIEQKTTYFNCKIRLSLSSELEKSNSFINFTVSFVHQDDKQFAAVLPFDQSFTGRRFAYGV